MHEITLIQAPKFSKAMKQAVLEGRKSCTTRTERKGEVGDKWPLGHMILEYTKIERHTLDYVATTLYREEGFQSPDEFRDTWCRLHRMKPSNYPADARYWKNTKYTHHFKEIKP
jgi:hypothetical protein